jgi:hypothetical protein
MLKTGQEGLDISAKKLQDFLIRPYEKEISALYEAFVNSSVNIDAELVSKVILNKIENDLKGGIVKIGEKSAEAKKLEEVNKMKSSLCYFVEKFFPDSLKIGELKYLLTKLQVCDKFEDTDCGDFRYFFTVMQIVWRLLKHEDGNLLTRSGCYFSASIEQAEFVMKQVKHFIINTSELKELLYDERLIWNVDRIELKNGASFYTKYYKMPMCGSHFGWAIADDYVGEDYVLNFEAKKRFDDMVQVDLIPCCCPNSHITTLNTSVN